MVKGEEPEMDAFLDCLGEQDVELRPRPASMVRSAALPFLRQPGEIQLGASG